MLSFTLLFAINIIPVISRTVVLEFNTNAVVDIVFPKSLVCISWPDAFSVAVSLIVYYASCIEATILKLYSFNIIFIIRLVKRIIDQTFLQNRFLITFCFCLTSRISPIGRTKFINFIFHYFLRKF